MTHDAAQSFYEEFSLAVGQRDWLQPNLRHEQLKLLTRNLFADRDDRRILDVGCGAGVLTDYLTRFGEVTGIDFSVAAIDAARHYAPKPTFLAGSLEQLSGRFDAITLFDVLEHIPADERPAFLESLADRLEPDGFLFCSTPHASATANRRAQDDPALQVIDEEVEVATVVEEATAAGLQLLNYRAYDVFAGSPEYQAFLFSPTRTPGGPPDLVPDSLRRRSSAVSRRGYATARRIRFAIRALRHGDLKTARWFLFADVSSVRS